MKFPFETSVIVGLITVYFLKILVWRD